MIETVDNLYSASATASVAIHPVANTPAKTFSVAVRRLQHMAFQTGEEELWARLLRHLKRYRYRSACAPLPFSHPEFCNYNTRAAILEALNTAAVGASPTTKA